MSTSVLKIWVAGIVILMCRVGASWAIDLEQEVEFRIPAQRLDAALVEFSKQARLQVVTAGEQLRDLRSEGVTGRVSVSEALGRILRDSGLSYRAIGQSAISIGRFQWDDTHSGIGHSQSIFTPRVARAEPQSLRLSQGEAHSSSLNEDSSFEESGEVGATGLPEILVTGSKVLNTDIRRTEDDIQPYVVFDRERIERSAAANLEEFFRKELTMSASTRIAAQNLTTGNRSSVNLRGLGEDETLILIDGRRVAGFNFEGDPNQPDINGIPLAAIERIEVLPTTASGIHGGGATGGVINIVLRRDYAGLETRLTYGNTFASDAMNRRVDLNAGFNLEDGKTNVLLAGSYSDARPLLMGERNFIQRGRQHIIDNSGGDIQALNEFGIIPPLGATPNIRSLTGGNLALDPALGGTDLGSPITFVPEGYAGVAATGDNGAALVANAGQYNLELANTAQPQGRRFGLLSAPEVQSLMMTLRREFTPRIQTFFELYASESSTQFTLNAGDLLTVIPGDAPTNPFQQPILASVPTVGMDEAIASESEDRRAVAGLITRLPRDWQAAVDYTWSRSRSSYTRSRRMSSSTVVAVQSGSLDVLRDVNEFPVAWEFGAPSSQSPGDMTLNNAALRFGGALPWSLPGGSLALSSVIEHRKESLGEVITVCGGCGGAEFFYPSRSQSVDSAYLEMRLPFVSAQNRGSGVELLELQVATRYDDYKVTGTHRGIPLGDPAPIERFTNRNTSFDPTVGLRYQPTPDVMLRASYGTGFLPPSMTQLAPLPPRQSNRSPYGLVDPLRGNEPITIIDSTSGGNPNLQPEQSESTSIGLVLTPRRLPGLRLKADWSQIDKTDNINLIFAESQANLELFIN